MTRQFVRFLRNVRRQYVYQLGHCNFLSNTFLKLTHSGLNFLKNCNLGTHTKKYNIISHIFWEFIGYLVRAKYEIKEIC